MGIFKFFGRRNKHTEPAPAPVQAWPQTKPGLAPVTKPVEQYAPLSDRYAAPATPAPAPTQKLWVSGLADILREVNSYLGSNYDRDSLPGTLLTQAYDAGFAGAEAHEDVVSRLLARARNEMNLASLNYYAEEYGRQFLSRAYNLGARARHSINKPSYGGGF